MPFPFSTRGVIAADPSASLNAAEAMTAISEALRDEKPSRMDVSTDTVTFAVNFFRIRNGRNPLVAISSGSIRCVQTPEGVAIHYHLSFIKMLLAVTIMVGLLFGVLARAPTPLLIAGWAWLFGGNYALTLYRFPRFLRNALSRSSRKE